MMFSSIPTGMMFFIAYDKSKQILAQSNLKDKIFFLKVLNKKLKLEN